MISKENTSFAGAGNTVMLSRIGHKSAPPCASQALEDRGSWVQREWIHSVLAFM